MQPAVNRLPTTVIILCLAIVAVEFLLTLGAQGFAGGAGGIAWRIEAMEQFAFFDRLWAFMAANNRWEMQEVVRIVTYPFVHLSFTHALFAAVFVLALGKFVGEALGEVAVVVVFFGSAIFGALWYAWIWDTPIPLAGAYPGAYGLIGAFTAVLFGRLGDMGANQLQAFQLIGILMALQLVFGLLFGGSPDWVADIAGAFAGFGLALIFQPGAAARILERFRQR